ncbi:MAG: 1-deoxy-D-xylulose-5-phosphate synthase [Candidatus Riflebacteria bacterium]|nr:1-deoxy-D-xylulose-5-phosphate synthase [Candidatus Riflebacteria bacterium]
MRLVDLNKITSPEQLKECNIQELVDLSRQIREKIIQVVSKNGGHLASNLGIVELTLAIHKAFSSPRDSIIFDVGHQCYVHKMITGRINEFPTLRKMGGLSGFPKLTESPHDAFDTGHASTSISAALGMAVARDVFQSGKRIVAVIGDGAMTGGMSFEAINHAGNMKSDLIVVLNDNEMSISPNVGALSRYLNKIRIEPYFKNPKEYLAHVVKQIPGFGTRLYGLLSRIEGSVKYLLTPGILFEDLGFKYLGPIDGYDFELLEKVFAYSKNRSGPVLIHVLTEKGRGYRPAMEATPKFHGVGPFEISTGEIQTDPCVQSYTSVFGDTLVSLASEDPNIVAVTAAMKEGTGLEKFSKLFPDRFFDVGIAEQHAVTFAAGMAAGGLKPVVAIYSTFMQRSIDQIIHDVALMKLPVVFCLDRAGLVGEDGPTHHGIFDITFLRMIPNLISMAPCDELELKRMLEFAFRSHCPVAIRYPRGTTAPAKNFQSFSPIQTGQAEILKKGHDLAVWALGNTLHPAIQAADELEKHGISTMVINPRFIKPLDEKLLERLFVSKLPMVTIEEGTLKGGFGSAILESAADMGYQPTILRIGLPDDFPVQGSQKELRRLYNLDSEGIADTILKWHTIPQFLKAVS